MPDTGAPWNIPYAAPADLVRDWPDLSEDVAEAVADGLDAAGNAGIGSNVVSVVDDTTRTTSIITFSQLSGTAAVITPSATSSKVLVLFSVASAGAVNANETLRIRLTRGGTQIGAVQELIVNASNFRSPMGYIFLDSPSTTSATTYEAEFRSATGGNVVSVYSTTMTVIEVEG
jgi:hypothetical protein